jgi:hypothetical protein
MMNPVSRIHPALLRKDNYFKTLPVGKLVKILALNEQFTTSWSLVVSLHSLIADCDLVITIL